MKDEDKTKKQLINKLMLMRRRVAELEKAESERKQAEEALQQSEVRYRNLVESSNDWVWEVDQNGVYTYASPHSRELLGYEPEELIGKKPFDLMPPDEARRVEETFASIAAQREPFRALVNTNRHRDGRLVILETNGVPVLDEEGNLRGYRGMDRDITERKRAEEALRQSEELLRVTLTNILDPVFITDNDGKFTFICPNVPHILGYSLEEIQAMGNISKLVGDGLFSPEELEMRGEITNIERLIVDNYGRQRVFLTTVKRVSIGEGTRLYAMHDITERKHAEEALRESEARFSTVFHASPMSIAITSLMDNKLVEVNETWQNLTGLTREEVIGRTPLEVNNWVDCGERDRLISNLSSGFTFFLAENGGFHTMVR